MCVEGGIGKKHMCCGNVVNWVPPLLFFFCQVAVCVHVSSGTCAFFHNVALTSFALRCCHKTAQSREILVNVLWQGSCDFHSWMFCLMSVQGQPCLWCSKCFLPETSILGVAFGQAITWFASHIGQWKLWWFECLSKLCKRPLQSNNVERYELRCLHNIWNTLHAHQLLQMQDTLLFTAYLSEGLLFQFVGQHRNGIPNNCFAFVRFACWYNP